MMTDKDLGRDLASEHRHEERALALAGKQWAGRDAMLKDIAAAFAEVEAEAKRECATAFAKEQCAKVDRDLKAKLDAHPTPRISKWPTPRADGRCAHGGYFSGMLGCPKCEPVKPTPDPGASGLPVPKIAPHSMTAVATWRAERDAMVDGLLWLKVHCGQLPIVHFTEFWSYPGGYGSENAMSPGAVDASYLVGIVSSLPDLHPLPKFTVPKLALPDLTPLIASVLRMDADMAAYRKSCTCGAASCGSRMHSSWCELA